MKKTLCFKNWAARLLILLPLVALTACSKTVQWEEEVPLNTGEVIWVKRTVEYKLQGAGGNPLDMAYRPDWTEEIAFEWKGKKYKYVGDADLMLLAISPNTQQPILVARADLKNWDVKNSYRCSTPFYVQLVSDERGLGWSWPPSIEPWLYGLPYNLMLHRAEMENLRSRYNAKDRADADYVMRHQSPSLTRIDPNFKFDQCKN